jgi:hypothetical protein
MDLVKYTKYENLSRSQHLTIKDILELEVGVPHILFSMNGSSLYDTCYSNNLRCIPSLFFRDSEYIEFTRVEGITGYWKLSFEKESIMREFDMNLSGDLWYPELREFGIINNIHWKDLDPTTRIGWRGPIMKASNMDIFNIDICLRIPFVELKESFIRDCFYNHRDLNWNRISKHQKLSNDLMWDCKDVLNWAKISRYQFLLEPMIRRLQHLVCWDIVCCFQTLSEPFIREFKNKINFKIISSFQKLSEPFMIEFQDKLNWEFISDKQVLSEQFIRNFENKLEWFYISESQVLSEQFIREFQHKIEFHGIYKVSESFVLEFINRLDLTYIIRRNQLSESAIRIIISYNPKYWKSICQYQKLSEEFIEQFKHIVSATSASYRHPLWSVSSFKSSVYWKIVSSYQKLSEEFICKFQNLVCWKNISWHQKLSHTFIKNFRDKIDMDGLKYRSRNVISTMWRNHVARQTDRATLNFLRSRRNVMDELIAMSYSPPDIYSLFPNGGPMYLETISILDELNNEIY